MSKLRQDFRVVTIYRDGSCSRFDSSNSGVRDLFDQQASRCHCRLARSDNCTYVNPGWRPVTISRD